MKTIFDKEVPQIYFERFMQKIQSKVMIFGLIFFASIVVRLFFEYYTLKEVFVFLDKCSFIAYMVIVFAIYLLSSRKKQSKN